MFYVGLAVLFRVLGAELRSKHDKMPKSALKVAPPRKVQHGQFEPSLPPLLLGARLPGAVTSSQGLPVTREAICKGFMLPGEAMESPDGAGMCGF